jgi:hypothetical protein
VAERYGLSKVRAYRIAHETLKPNPQKDEVLMRAITREMDARRRPVALRRLIRRIGLPFLEKRQRSTIGIYGAGGRPVKVKG